MPKGRGQEREDTQADRLSKLKKWFTKFGAGVLGTAMFFTISGCGEKDDSEVIQAVPSASVSAEPNVKSSPSNTVSEEKSSPTSNPETPEVSPTERNYPPEKEPYAPNSEHRGMSPSESYGKSLDEMYEITAVPVDSIDSPEEALQRVVQSSVTIQNYMMTVEDYGKWANNPDLPDRFYSMYVVKNFHLPLMEKLMNRDIQEDSDIYNQILAMATRGTYSLMQASPDFVGEEGAKYGYPTANLSRYIEPGSVAILSTGTDKDGHKMYDFEISDMVTTNGVTQEEIDYITSMGLGPQNEDFTPLEPVGQKMWIGITENTTSGEYELNYISESHPDK